MLRSAPLSPNMDKPRSSYPLTQIWLLTERMFSAQWEGADLEDIGSLTTSDGERFMYEWIDTVIAVAASVGR